MLSNLIRRRGEDRAGMSWSDYLHLWTEMGFNGVQYVMPSGGMAELTAIQAGRNPIVWACISLRLLVFSEVRFVFQGWRAGRPGDLFGTQALTTLETPWQNATTGDLLARMEVDASFYGNSYWIKSGQYLTRLDPTRVQIATSDILDPSTGHSVGKRLIGYLLKDREGQDTAAFLPEEVAHYRPLPDPQHEFRGISWMGALLPDIIADLDMSDFKHAFLSNAATPSLVVKFQPGTSQEAFDKFKEKMEASHTGPKQGFKTLYLGAGADVSVVGQGFHGTELNFLQAAGETRIASAAGVPPTLLSLSEGLKGSALNQGNYSATRKRFSDGTMRPLWRSACGALSTLCTPPPGSRLWYDGRDVPFLQEDESQAADNRAKDASTMLQLVNAGWEPDTIVEFIATGDHKALVHSGLVSVQLQPPGTAIPAPAPPAALPAGV